MEHIDMTDGVLKRQLKQIKEKNKKLDNIISTLNDVLLVTATFTLIHFMFYYFG